MLVGEVHQLSTDVGVDQARNLASDKHERQCIEAAYSVLSDDKFELNILHSGFAMTALPHRSTKELVWERSGGQKGEVKLHIKLGHLSDRTPVGIPFVSMARSILIHLSSEAVKNNSRVCRTRPFNESFFETHGGFNRRKILCLGPGSKPPDFTLPAEHSSISARTIP